MSNILDKNDFRPLILAGLVIAVIVILTVLLFVCQNSNSNMTSTFGQNQGRNQNQKIKVFSFSLYGKHDKYCLGMIRNVEQIRRNFPGWQVWIYMAPDVPAKTRMSLSKYKIVRIIPCKGTVIDRFMAIDDPRVQIMMVRDADSRIHDRDAGCIRQFDRMKDKSFHIIRDHNGHWYKILAGMWGMKKQAFKYLKASTMQSIYENYTGGKAIDTSYGYDQDFLAKAVYPNLCMRSLLVHDGKHKFEKDTSVNYPFPVALNLKEKDFVGQAYHIGNDGQDVAEYKIEDYGS